MLSFIPGPMMEENFRSAMLLSHGNLMVLVEQPISAGLVACAAMLLVLIALPNARTERESMFGEEA